MGKTDLIVGGGVLVVMGGLWLGMIEILGAGLVQIISQDHDFTAAMLVGFVLVASIIFVIVAVRELWVNFHAKRPAL